MAVVKHSHSGRFNKAFLWVKGQYSYRLRCGEAPDQERGGAVWEFRTKMADYGHTKGWGSSQGPISWLTPRPWPPARWWTQADPACTDPPPHYQPASTRACPHSHPCVLSGCQGPNGGRRAWRREWGRSQWQSIQLIVDGRRRVATKGGWVDPISTHAVWKKGEKVYEILTVLWNFWNFITFLEVYSKEQKSWNLGK